MDHVRHEGIPWETRSKLMAQTNEKKFKETGELHAFYGSLRKGEYNADRVASDGYKYIKTVTITGFKLFALGGYPAVSRSDNMEDTIVVDLFRITDVKRAAGIYNMELGASYFLEKEQIGDEEYTIYTFTKGWGNNRPVPSGDWVKFRSKKAEAVS
jgi:gamma-glutamylcyclotransferase (GGCT)/AIG2-like uncharacterized protein YtfP